MFGTKTKRARAENDLNARVKLGEVLRNVISILKTAPTGSDISHVRITFHKDSLSGAVAMNPISFERGSGTPAVPEDSWAKLDQVLIIRIKGANLEQAVRTYTQKYACLRERDVILIAVTGVTFIERHVSIPF